MLWGDPLSQRYILQHGPKDILGVSDLLIDLILAGPFRQFPKGCPENVCDAKERVSLVEVSTYGSHLCFLPPPQEKT